MVRAFNTTKMLDRIATKYGRELNWGGNVVQRLPGARAEAGVAAIANPLINITLQGRHDSYPKRRGMTRVPELMAARARMHKQVISALDSHFAGRPDDGERAADAYLRCATYCQDIILAQVSLLEANEAADQRGRQSEQFERRVAELVRASSDQSRALTERTRATSFTSSRAATLSGCAGNTSAATKRSSATGNPCSRRCCRRRWRSCSRRTGRTT